MVVRLAKGEDYNVTIQGASPGLYNEDLAPAKVRNWGPFSIFNVWTSDVHSLWGYYLAASLFLFCGGFCRLGCGFGLLLCGTVTLTVRLVVLPVPSLVSTVIV